MAKAYVNGLQSTFDENGEDLGWGKDSLNAIIKHFPGNGTAEAGRETHNSYGKYNVYPGDNFDTQLLPFKATLELEGKTGSYANSETIREAFRMYAQAHGEEALDARARESVRRIQQRNWYLSAHLSAIRPLHRRQHLCASAVPGW